MSDDFWRQARAQMLLEPTATNLNTGSFGPLSRVVFERVTDLRRCLAAEPMDFLVRQAPPLLWTAPGEILLTDHEYGAMHWCWERAAQRQGLTVRTFALPAVPTSPAEIVAAADAALTERTRLLFFSHVLSPTGLVLPARELIACQSLPMRSKTPAARVRRSWNTAVAVAHTPANILDLESRCTADRGVYVPRAARNVPNAPQGLGIDGLVGELLGGIQLRSIYRGS